MPSLGSSPRVRGEEASMMILAPGEGIIPAGAGRSLALSPRWNTRRDHPRGCGEKPRAEIFLHDRRGSSPRVRGEVLLQQKTSPAIGIIPAGAGRSETPKGKNFVHRDHPRGCGEKWFVSHCGVPFVGSSPRVRGEVLALSPVAILRRIIPAGAGRSGPLRPRRQA